MIKIKILNKASMTYFAVILALCLFAATPALAGLWSKNPVIELTEVQLILNKLGYSCNADGMSSAKTTQAIKAFQRKNHLKINGSIDVKTQDALIINYLFAKSPEVVSFKKKCKNKYVIYVEEDPNDKDDYYGLYVGSNGAISTTRWTNFMIKRDFSEILVNEPGSDKNMPLEQWQTERVIYDAVLSNAEKAQIKKQIYLSHKVSPGLRFNLKLHFKSNNWYYLVLTPISRTFTDRAAVILQRKEKVWVVHYLGTGGFEEDKDFFRKEGAPQSFLDNLRS